MKDSNKFSYINDKSLTKQIVIIIAVIMLVPLLALMYDIFFASRTDEIVFLDKEQRLEALVKNTNSEFLRDLESHWSGQTDIPSTLLHSEFTRVVEPLVPANLGIRFGLYVPRSEKITVLGFLHAYRYRTPEEEAQRERDIYASTKLGLIAAEIGNEHFSCCPKRKSGSSYVGRGTT